MLASSVLLRSAEENSVLTIILMSVQALWALGLCGILAGWLAGTHFDSLLDLTVTPEHDKPLVRTCVTLLMVALLMPIPTWAGMVVLMYDFFELELMTWALLLMQLSIGANTGLKSWAWRLTSVPDSPELLRWGYRGEMLFQASIIGSVGTQGRYHSFPEQVLMLGALLALFLSFVIAVESQQR